MKKKSKYLNGHGLFKLSLNQSKNTKFVELHVCENIDLAVFNNLAHNRNKNI
jgi:hypothetical protein